MSWHASVLALAPISVSAVAPASADALPRSAKRSVAPERRASLGAIALFSVVALAPLPYGSNTPSALAIMALGIGAGLGCCSTRALRLPHLALLSAIAILALASGAVVALQSLPGSWGASAIWRDLSTTLPVDAPAIRSVVRGQPVIAAGNLACCLGALTLGLVVGAEGRSARRLIDVFAWSGLAYAAYGVLSDLADPTTLLFRERENYVGAVLGPFVNRNTAATYFACTATVWASILTDALVEGERSRRILLGLGSATAVCVTALLMTNSRAGVLLGVGAITSGVAYLARDHLLALSPRLRVAAGGLTAALSLTVLAGGVTGQRLQALGFADEGRLSVYQAVLRLVRDYPWLGTGLGTFAWIYPTYRSPAPGMRNLWDKAHSTPLELAAELGLPLAILIGIAALGAFAILVHGLRTRRRDRIVPMAGAWCFGIAVLHSCVDFSLQIPGVAIVVMALLGAGLAQSFSTRRWAVKDPKSRPADDLGGDSAPSSVR